MKKFWKIIRLPLQILLSVGILWFLTHKLGAREILDTFAKTSWQLLAGCTLLYLIAQILSAWRWWWVSLSVRFGGGVWEYIRLFFLGMFYNLFLPSGYGGDVLKIFYQAPLRTPPSKRMAGLTVLIDRLAGLVSILLLGGAASCGLTVRAVLEWGVVMSSLFFLTILICLGAVWVLSKAKKVPRKVRAVALLMRSSAVDYVGILVLSVAIQLINVAMFVWIFYALGIELSLWRISFAYALVTLATLLPVSIGGLGVRESGWAAMLSSFGLAPASGVTAGLIFFIAQTICSILGLWPFLTLRRAKAEELEDISVDD